MSCHSGGPDFSLAAALPAGACAEAVCWAGTSSVDAFFAAVSFAGSADVFFADAFFEVVPAMAFSATFRPVVFFTGAQPVYGCCHLDLRRQITPAAAAGPTASARASGPRGA
ncbi:hypothetical protein ACFQ9Z_34695 [Streptomyces sp. NPDC056580]|uniref:hypothetical protein n=1 Tax=Streptomyces sp. NPDC056580 TaxID=3345872 RepID=UPI0036C4BE2A